MSQYVEAASDAVIAEAALVCYGLCEALNQPQWCLTCLQQTDVCVESVDLQGLTIAWAGIANLWWCQHQGNHCIGYQLRTLMTHMKQANCKEAWFQ